MNGSKRSFQAKKKWNRATATIAALACGTMIVSNVRNGPAPSIVAASTPPQAIVLPVELVARADA